MFQSVRNVLYIKTNPKKISFLSTIFKCIRIFSTTPNYNFSTRQVENQIYYFLWGLDYSISVTSKILLMLTNVLGCLNLIFSFLGSYFCTGAWEKFFQHCYQLESSDVLIVLETTKETLFIFDKTFIFIVSTSFVVVDIIVETVLWYDGLTNLLDLYYTAFIYHSSIVCFLVIYITLYFNDKLVDINNVLVQSSESTEPKMGINKTKQLYNQVANIVDLFNHLFGKQLLLITLVFSIDVLTIWITLYQAKKRDTATYSMTIMYSIYTMLVQFCLMMSCDKAKRASEKLLITCLNLQEKYPSTSEEYHELSMFIDKLNNRKISFTAANFFEIHRSTMFAVIGNTTTYFIALVQFGNSS
ncbi:hypothetical protein GWI33_008353 [Rhynchophorus ferrugineus]|uniref:Gustatory receptor n=1 Tax=Rhynchophorus ferrugineus TaxID=354439 RepID=A0A834MMK2_RHYFE|nr:hypothetical protein GWI33_008353 [Rhynchophorus ferrugineus]